MGIASEAMACSRIHESDQETIQWKEKDFFACPKSSKRLACGETRSIAVPAKVGFPGLSPSRRTALHAAGANPKSKRTCRNASSNLKSGRNDSPALSRKGWGNEKLDTEVEAAAADLR